MKPLTLSHSWSAAQKIFFRWGTSYVVLFITSFSFPHALFPDIGKWLSPFWGWLSGSIGSVVWGKELPYASELISDASGLYIHAFLLVLIAGGIAVIWGMLDRNSEGYPKLWAGFLWILRYYVAIQLLAYGCSKVFKWQFYLPEPNILYTEVGMIPRDILYWSLMGTARGYTIFAGMLEIGAALLLMFRQTRFLGGLVGVGVMANVLAINFGFDISVKLYSSFLLGLCVVVMLPDLPRFIQFLQNRPTQPTPLWHPTLPKGKPQTLYRIGKILLLLWVFADAFFLYFQAQNFNDDAAARPPLHGAYQVQTFVLDGDTLAPDVFPHARWQRMFIHREGYLITQNEAGEMADYETQTDTIQEVFLLQPDPEGPTYSLSYFQPNESSLIVHGDLLGHRVKAYMYPLDWEGLPLLKGEFHWTLDGIE